MRISQRACCISGVLSLTFIISLPSAGIAQVQKSVRPPVKSNVSNGPTTFAKDASGITGGPKTTLGSVGTSTQNSIGNSGFATGQLGQRTNSLNNNIPNNLNNTQMPGAYVGPYPVPYPVPYPQPYYAPTPYPGQYYPGAYPYVAPMPYYSPYQQVPYAQYPQYPQVSPYSPMYNAYTPSPYANQNNGYPGANPYGANDTAPYGNPWQGNRPPVFVPPDGFGMGSAYGMGFGFRGMWN